MDLLLLLLLMKMLLLELFVQKSWLLQSLLLLMEGIFVVDGAGVRRWRRAAVDQMGRRFGDGQKGISRRGRGGAGRRRRH